MTQPKKETVRLVESRKFRVLLLAVLVYLLPVVLTFALVVLKLASKDDLLGTTKWCAAALSPAFLAYIGGVALEDAAKAKPGRSE